MKHFDFIYKAIIASLFFLLPFTVFSQTVAERNIQNRILTAVEFFTNDRLDEAAGILSEVIAASPDEDAAHFYLGLIYYKQNKMEEAESALETAAGLDPKNFWYKYRLANLYSVTGKSELTLALYEQMVEAFPKRYELYYDMIDLYLSQNQPEKALETLGHIETVFGKNEMTAIAKFDLLRKLERPEEAYSALEDYNKEFSSAQIITLLADRQLSQYKDSVALAMYEEALDIVPGYAPALVGKAEAYRMTRKYERFFETLSQLMTDKNVVSAGKCSYLEALLGSSGPTFMRIFRNQVDSLVSECIATHPGDTLVNLTAGRYYYSTGRNDMAKERFLENMEMYPESLSAAVNFTELLMYTNQWDSLATESIKAYEKFPKETGFLEMASLAEYSLGNNTKVIELCNKIISVAQGDSIKRLNAYSTMGDIYYHTGDKKKAYKSYDNALKINPDYAPVLNNYAYYLSLDKKKLSKALSMSKKTVDANSDNSTYLDTYAWILYLQGKYQEAKPVLKNAVMLYGGKESAVILDHYAEVLYALKEYDLAFLYWKQAKAKNDGKITDLDERISARKEAIGRK